MSIVGTYLVGFGADDEAYGNSVPVAGDDICGVISGFSSLSVAADLSAATFKLEVSGTSV